MQNRRTDLAMEAGEAAPSLAGISSEERVRDGFHVTTVRVADSEAANALNKPVGNYVTLDLQKLIRRESDAFSLAAYALAGELSELVCLAERDTVLIVGLGNRAITPDAVGPETIRNVMVTSHLKARPGFSSFRSVCALETGVLGTTGIESARIIKAVTESVRHDCVLVVHALASRRL